MLSRRDFSKSPRSGSIQRVFARIPGGTLDPLSDPRKAVFMFDLIVSICLLLFLILAGADLLVSNIDADELSKMGVEEKL